MPLSAPSALKSSDSPEFNQAIQREVVWKNEELKTFCIALIREALKIERLSCSGVSMTAELNVTVSGGFTTDIVPDEIRNQGGRTAGAGIPGTAAKILATAGLIQPEGVWRGDKFYQERVKSTRKCRHGAVLNVYRLTSHALAEAFLQRYGQPILLRQPDLQLA